jgi:hypothetical protein
MASTKAATIRGVFLKPGLSKNRRLYTKDNISKAVERMKQQLASGDGMPLNMATSHAAAFKDDATSTVGRITKVWQNSDGSAAFEADIANTAHGRDVANLAVGKFIKGISIRGSWATEPKSIVHTDGNEAVTADDLEVDGVDFTNSPGVDGAEIQYASLAESYTSGNPMAIFESVDEMEIIPVEENNDNEEMIRTAVENAVEGAISAIFEKDSKKPYGDVKYADPGYQSDKQKRYPIDTAAHVRAAWSYINQADNAKLYSAAQLSRIKSRIKSAAKKFGIEIQEEYVGLISDIQEILEAYASTTLATDVATINVSGAGVPEELPQLAAKLAQTAIVALNFLDPDADDDIDDGFHIEPSAQANPTKECAACGCECNMEAGFCHECGEAFGTSTSDMATTPTSNPSVPECAECGESVPQDAMYCPTCGIPVPQAESSDTALTQTEEEVTVTDDQTTVETPAEETALESNAPTRTLSDADLQALASVIAAALRPVENTEPEAAAAEVAPEEEAVEAPAEEEAAEEVAAEESIESQENTVSENTFTADQVAAMIAEAAAKAATEAVAAAQKSAVESYRSGATTFRKGLVAPSMGESVDLEDIDPRALAEMNSQAFRAVQTEAWSNTPFFAAKFAQADRGF